LSWIGQLVGGIRGLFVWWVIVTPWEQALRVRAGRRLRKLGPGLHFRVPYIDVVFRQAMRLRMCDLAVQTVTTKDGRTLTLRAQVAYEILDLGVLYNTLHEGERAIDNMARGAIAKFVAENEAIACAPSAIEERCAALLDLGEFGLRVRSVQITDYAFVRTYRVIKQDVWSTVSDRLNTQLDEGELRRRNNY
jgi:hypothetical protein